MQAGDEEAFADLFNRFGPWSLRYLEGLLDSEAAQDAHQEVWLTVYRRISDLANPGGFRTWLFRTTRHRAIDFLRGERRESVLFDLVAREGPEILGVPVGSAIPTFADPALKTVVAQFDRSSNRFFTWITLSR